jgi:hypothetical protein
MLPRSMTTEPFRPDRARALREAFRRAESVGPIRPAAIGLAGGLVAAYVADGLLVRILGTPLRQIVDAAIFVAVMAPLWLLVQPAGVRRAVDVMTWLNGWETERWQGEIGRRLPALPRATPALLASLPDTMGLRPLRIELLAVAGEWDEARQRLEQLPTDTPWQRFERAALGEWISFLSDGPELIGPMRLEATRVDDTERSLVARAMVAAAEARRAAVDDGDAVGPLAALHPALGDRAGRYAFRYATGIVVNVALIGLIASLGVMVAAAVMR